MEHILSHYTTYRELEDDGRAQRHMYVFMNAPQLPLAEPLLDEGCRRYFIKRPGAKFAAEGALARKTATWLTVIAKEREARDDPKRNPNFQLFRWRSMKTIKIIHKSYHIKTHKCFFSLNNSFKSCNFQGPLLILKPHSSLLTPQYWQVYFQDVVIHTPESRLQCEVSTIQPPPAHSLTSEARGAGSLYQEILRITVL